MFSGSIPALVTPFRDGAFDEAAFRRLVEWQIENGSSALVPCGTTGENSTLSNAEHHRVIEVCVEQAAGRVPVMAGCGANSTKEAIELARFAKDVGADSQLQVVPYYNKPTQEGQYQHFKAIAEAVDLPMILYNVPGRTVADLGNEAILRLAQVPGIVGIKDATGNIERGADLLMRVPVGFNVYSGDDATAIALMLLGGRGSISVTANVAPRLMHQMCAAAIAGNAVLARELNQRLIGLHRNLFLEANPIPVKWAVQQMGLIAGGIRLPMTRFSAEFHDRLRLAMRDAGIAV